MSALHFGPPAKRAAAIRVPGDKSISHRAVMLAACARGTTAIRGINRGGDVSASIQALLALGAVVDDRDYEIRVTGSPFARDAGTIDCGNSGTTMRLCMGLLAGRTNCTLDGDASLRRRPMERVAQPLRTMGASIATAAGKPPVALSHGSAELHGRDLLLPVASAQVKSALLLAGLRANGVTVVRSPHASRDHTERMLAAMGAPIAVDGAAISIRAGELTALESIHVPGDFSAAMFFIAAVAAGSSADVLIENLGVNPTRTSALDVMRGLGAAITQIDDIMIANEPRATLSVRCGSKGVAAHIGPADVPALIDEIPVLCAFAALRGVRLDVSGASELRVKESDRIASTGRLLRAFGARVDVLDDGLIVHEGASLRAPARVETEGDHRIGMTAAVMAVALESPIEIANADCIATSFPDFAATWSAAFGIAAT